MQIDKHQTLKQLTPIKDRKAAIILGTVIALLVGFLGIFLLSYILMHIH